MHVNAYIVIRLSMSFGIPRRVTLDRIIHPLFFRCPATVSCTHARFIVTDNLGFELISSVANCIVLRSITSSFDWFFGFSVSSVIG